MTYIAEIAAMPCILCELLGLPQTSKTDAHHLRFGMGMAQRNHDELAVPLCHDGCHQGPRGIHGDRSLLRVANVDEVDLLAYTLRRRNGGTIPRPSKVAEFKPTSKILPRNNDRPWPPRAA